MAVEIKFCGLTRQEDADHAAALGAAYVGVIFAGGPRTLTPDRAANVLANVPADVTRVGVFADQSDEEILRAMDRAGLGVAQLHGTWDAARCARLRARLGRDVWPVVRVPGASLPAHTSDAFRAGNGTVLDAFVPGGLGGTGVALPWAQLSAQLEEIRTPTPVILAGGLRPENVAIAISALSPDIVDVSSGVESAPGLKDHDRMRAFRDAVVHASIPT